jgi:hypothetical protein
MSMMLGDTEVHTAEPLVHGPSHLEFKISIAKLRKYKSSGSDQIQAGGEILLSEMQKQLYLE